MEDTNSMSGSGVCEQPLPLTEPAPAPLKPYLRGTASIDNQSVVIRGRWAFSKSDFDEDDPNKVSPFEFTYLGDSSSIIANKNESFLPPSGDYKGYICLKVEGRPHVRTTEQDLVLTISQQDGISGKGYNKYGRFELQGHVLDNLQEVEFYKSYTGEPAPDKPKKRPKELKKNENSVKRARQQLAIAAPINVDKAPPTPVVEEEPCMRGEMETTSEGALQIKGRWAIRMADFDTSPKSTSPFDYVLNDKVSDGLSLPVNGRYSGGFHMKMQGRSKRVKEADIEFQFIESSSEAGVFDLKANGSNEFGIFTMRGTARPSMNSSSSSKSLTIEIFRTYTSYHPAPVVPKSGRGWAIEGPTLSTPSSTSMSRQASAPASKEPRSGLTSRNKGNGTSSTTSSSKLPPPPSASLTSSVSDSGRKRKAPNKLVDELSRGEDLTNFDVPTKNKLEGIIRHLKSKESSVYFLEPVDPIRLGIPTYFDIIKEPMDLKTIEKKLLSNIFLNPNEFANDIRLIFSNSKLFNQIDKSSPVYLATLKLSEIFENKWIDFELWYQNRIENEKEKALLKPPTSSSKSKNSNGNRKRQVNNANNNNGSGGGDSDEFRRMQSKMMEMSEEILNLQRATTTQHIQLQIAAATGGNKRKGQKISVQDVLGNDEQSEILLDSIPLTIEEKETVAKQVDKLPVHKLNRVLEIVQEQMQLSGFHDQDDDIELDIDTMPTKTLRALQRYLKECFPPRKVATTKPRAPRPSKKKPAPLPVPAYVPPVATSSSQPEALDNGHQNKRSKLSSSSTSEGPPMRSVPPLMKSGDDTSDSEEEGSKTPWASNVPVDTASSRRLAGLDSDSEDDEPPVSTQPSVIQPPTQATPAVQPKPVMEAAPQVRLVEVSSVPQNEVKVANAGAWTAASWGSAEPSELNRQRSDSYDDTANNWSQLHSDIQEKQQVDEHRKMEEVKLMQQQQHQQEEAVLQARRLQELQKRNEETARLQAAAQEEEAERRLVETREIARRQREGVSAVDLDANKTREDVGSFMDDLLG